MADLNRNYCPRRQFTNADWYPHGRFGPGPVSSVGYYDVATVVWSDTPSGGSEEGREGRGNNATSCIPTTCALSVIVIS